MATKTPQAATFKIFDSEAEKWVDLTLQPGETKELHAGGKHEEGHSYQYWTYTHEDDHIRCEYDSSDRDCDGATSDHCVTVCPLDRLKASPAEPDNQWPLPARPDWQRESSSQRDYSAEAAGY